MIRRLPAVPFPALAFIALFVACQGDVAGPSAPPPPAPVLLKDVVGPNLPAPYYHFDYDAAQRIAAVSFASGLRAYDVDYQDGRIAAMRNNALGNTERLLYDYDDSDRVSAVRYVNASDQVFAIVFLTYAGERLTGIERDRRVPAGFLAEKLTTFSYDADGNVAEVAETFRTDSGTTTTAVDRYERYDTLVNVDAFTLIHDEFFDHVVLLPGVQLQRGNPGRVTRTGDGINFVVDYTYTYDAGGRPLVKSGDLVLTNGNDAGRHFATRLEYSYY